MNMSDYVVSVIRTVVPVAIGALSSWLLTKYAFHVDPSVQTSVTALLTAAVTGAYYTGVRFLETKFPKGPWGYFLGHTAKPTYVNVKQNAVRVISTGGGGGGGTS